MAIPTEIFNPHRTPIDTLKRITVGRESLIRRIHESLCLSQDDHNTPHWLIHGPRGMGKTHLLLVLFDKMRTDPRTANQWVVLHLREEEYWRSYSAPTFLRSILNQLVEKNIEKFLSDTPGIEKALLELKGMKSGEEMLIKVRALLDKVCRKLKRRLVIGVENFDSLFSQFKDKKIDAHQLRDFIQHSSYISMIGTTITTELGTEITSTENPFYRFFRLERLERLTFKQQIKQLYRIAEVDDDQTRRQRVHKFLIQKITSLEIVHRLSGGNPRLGIILYGVLGGPETIVEALDLLHELLDKNTPYFQDRMKDLAPMERTLAAAFCEANTTLTAAEAARIAGMDTNVTYSLITRMERAGFIEPVDYLGEQRKQAKPYQVAEDLFRMWWQYRFDAEQLVRKVVHFLAYVYKREELREIHRTLKGRTKIGSCPPLRGDVPLRYVSEAITFQEMPEYFKLKQTYGLVAEESSELMTVSEETPKSKKKEEDIQREVRQLKKRLKLPDAKIMDWLKLIELSIQIDDLQSAEKACMTVINLDPVNPEAWSKLGVINLRKKDYRSAQEAFEKFVVIDPGKAKTWFNLGLSRWRQENYRGAQEAFEAGLKLDGSNARAWLDLSSIKLGEKDYQGAQEACNECLQLDPTNAVAYAKLGIIYGEQKDYRNAQEAFEKCLEIDPSKSKTWFNLGLLKRRQENYQGAQEAFETGLELDSSDSRAWFNLGLIKMAQNDYKGAEKKFERGLQLDPVDKGAWVSLGKVKREQKDYEGALKAFEKALELDPSYTISLLNLGTTKLRQNDYKGAQAAFEKVIGLDPGNTNAWGNLGATKARQNDYQGAQAAFEEAVELNPSNANTWGNLGIAKLRQSDYQGAQAAFEEAVELNPSNANTWGNLGIAKLRQSDYQGAQAAFEKAVELNPSNADAWHNLGIAKLRQSDYQGSQAAFEKVVELNSSNADAWNSLGIAKLSQSDYQGALEAFKKAIELNPSNADAWDSLGVTKAELKEYQGAMEAFEKAIELDPASASAWSNLGVTKFELKEYEGAQAATKTALQLDGSDPKMWSNLGEINIALNDYKGAKEAFDSSMKLNPTDSRVWIEIIRLTSEQGDKEGVSEIFNKLNEQNPASLLPMIVQFFSVSKGLLGLEDTIQTFIDSGGNYSSNDQMWPKFLSAASDALLNSVDISETKQLEARIDLVEKLSKCRPELGNLEALESLTFVFKYFLARIAPLKAKVPAGKKLTPKQRGEWVLATVPREQRQAIRHLIEKVKSEANQGGSKNND